MKINKFWDGDRDLYRQLYLALFSFARKAEDVAEVKTDLEGKNVDMVT